MQVNRDYLRARGGFPYRGPVVGHGIEIRDAVGNLRTGRDSDRNIFSALRQAGRNVSGHARSGYWLMARTLTAQQQKQQKQSDAVSGKPRFAIFGFFETSMLAVFKK